MMGIAQWLVVLVALSGLPPFNDVIDEDVTKAEHTDSLVGTQAAPRQTPIQVTAAAFGVVFLLVGVHGFVPGITTNLGDIAAARGFVEDLRAKYRLPTCELLSRQQDIGSGSAGPPKPGVNCREPRG